MRSDHFSCSHKLAYKHQLLCCNQNKLCFLLQKKILWVRRCIKWKHLGLQKGFYPTFHSLISDGFRWRRFRVRISIVQLFRGSRRYLVPRQKSWLRRRWGHIWRRSLTDNSYGWSNKRQVCLTLLESPFSPRNYTSLQDPILSQELYFPPKKYELENMQ